MFRKVYRLAANIAAALLLAIQLMPSWAGAMERVPSCCRRDGEHACHAQRTSADDGILLQVTQRCPARNAGMFFATSPRYVIPAGQPLCNAFSEEPVLPPAADIIVRNAFARLPFSRPPPQ